MERVAAAAGVAAEVPVCLTVVCQLATNDCRLLSISGTIQAGSVGPVIQQALDVTNLQWGSHQ